EPALDAVPTRRSSELFYLVGPEGLDSDGRRFVRVDAEGLATDGSGRRFDWARNWALLEHLLTDRRARVQYVFLWHPIIERLLEQDRKSTRLNSSHVKL